MSMMEQLRHDLMNMEQELILQITAAIVLVFAVAYVFMNHMEVVTTPCHLICDFINT